MRAVAERTELRATAAAERDGAPAGVDRVPVLVGDGERPTHDQRPVLVRCDDGLVRHGAALPRRGGLSNAGVSGRRPFGYRGVMQAAVDQPARERPLSRRFGPLTRFGELWLLTPPGVFVPRSDAGMLLEAAQGRIGGRVLDLCTGSGVLALSVQPYAARVTAVDASALSAATARLNAALNRRQVEVLHGDLFAPVAGRRFDAIVSNPPY